MPRLLAIGDVHGCCHSLKTVISLVKPAGDDTLVTLGDYIDRGPDSKGVIDTLIALRDKTRLISLRGNHEIMMMDARANPGEASFLWMINGGQETAASYDAHTMDDIPAEHWRFLESCVPHHETETHLFAHANLDPLIPLEAQPEDLLFWEHLSGEVRHLSGKRLICGHTPQRSGHPLVMERTVCIDTGACRGGWLTCLDVISGHCWQANESGDTRELRLEFGFAGASA